MTIRRTVFVEEQGIDESLEIDGKDSEAWHVVALNGEKPIGTGRLLPNGVIGRVAVLQEYRGQGIGKLLMVELLKVAAENDFKRVSLSSQVPVVEFYEKLGFKVTGEIYEEAGILHRPMIREI